MKEINTALHVESMSVLSPGIYGSTREVELHGKSSQIFEAISATFGNYFADNSEVCIFNYQTLFLGKRNGTVHLVIYDRYRKNVEGTV